MVGVAKRKPWTRRDQVLVLELYARTPFGRMHSKNPEVVELAEFLERSSNSVAMKLANFAALDETLDRKGLKGASKADKEIWNEFFADPGSFFELARSLRAAAGEWPTKDECSEPPKVREGKEALRTVKVRRNQSAFRAMVLSAYNSRCAVTAIDSPGLLIASHIVPWRVNEKLRLDPRNGICLNSLHDRAFDIGLITLGRDLSIICSPKLSVPNEMRTLFDGRVVSPPDKFYPLAEYLEFHRDMIFQAS